MLWLSSTLLNNLILFHQLQGGEIFAKNVFAFLNKYVLTAPGQAIDLDATMMDEYLGWAVAACGLWFQLFNAFELPFPFNVVLFPLTFAEFVLEWLVTFVS